MRQVMQDTDASVDCYLRVTALDPRRQTCRVEVYSRLSALPNVASVAVGEALPPYPRVGRKSAGCITIVRESEAVVMVNLVSLPETQATRPAQ
jgi:hypothetical protein